MFVVGASILVWSTPTRHSSMAYSKEADKTRTELILGMCKQNTKTTPGGSILATCFLSFRVSKLMGFDQCGFIFVHFWGCLISFCGKWFFKRFVCRVVG